MRFAHEREEVLLGGLLDRFLDVPISMGGLGVREATLALLLGRFGIPFSGSVGRGLI